MPFTIKQFGFFLFTHYNYLSCFMALVNIPKTILNKMSIFVLLLILKEILLCFIAFISLRKYVHFCPCFQEFFFFIMIRCWILSILILHLVKWLCSFQYHHLLLWWTTVVDFNGKLILAHLKLTQSHHWIQFVSILYSNFTSVSMYETGLYLSFF